MRRGHIRDRVRVTRIIKEPKPSIPVTELQPPPVMADKSLNCSLTCAYPPRLSRLLQINRGTLCKGEDYDRPVASPPPKTQTFRDICPFVHHAQQALQNSTRERYKGWWRGWNDAAMVGSRSHTNGLILKLIASAVRGSQLRFI